jgi:hypothetical protein
MYAIEFTRTLWLRAGVDPGDAHWTRCLERYETEKQAEDDMGWLELENDGYTHRVVEVAE